MRRGVAPLFGLLSTSGRAAAHAGHQDHGGVPTLLPPVLFLAGLVVLGTSVYLDHRGLTDRFADVGVALGVLGLVVGLLALFL